MTDKLNFPSFISTYQRTLLSDWGAMVDLISKHATLLKERYQQKTPAQSSSTMTLSERQIRDALEGPFGSALLEKIAVFSALARIRMALYIDKEDTLKENLGHADKTRVLDPKKLAAIDSDTLLLLQEQLNQLLKDHNQQLEGKVFLWQMNLLNDVKEAGLSLSDSEIEDFNALEPYSELLERYAALNIEPGKTKLPLSFDAYLQLKIHLVILNSLARQHLAHTDKDIQLITKALKKSFQSIHKEHQELLKDQASELTKAFQSIKFAQFPQS